MCSLARQNEHETKLAAGIPDAYLGCRLLLLSIHTAQLVVGSPHRIGVQLRPRNLVVKAGTLV